MNRSTTSEVILWSHCSQEEEVGPNRRRAGWHTAVPRTISLGINLGGFFLCGAAILCLLATFQKLGIGAPLVIEGYIVPFCFGGLSGACIGHYITRLRGLNARLRQRVDILEEFMPLCSGCGRVRKPGAEPTQQDSWLPVETYISEHTDYRFSHGLCPDCVQRLYPEHAEEILKRSRSPRDG